MNMLDSVEELSFSGLAYMESLHLGIFLCLKILALVLGIYCSFMKFCFVCDIWIIFKTWTRFESSNKEPSEVFENLSIFICPKISSSISNLGHLTIFRISGKN